VAQGHPKPLIIFNPCDTLRLAESLRRILLLAVMIGLSQDGSKYKGIEGPHRKLKSEHKKITIHRNAEDDSTHDQSKDHLVPAKPFHKNLNSAIK
jgi:hypothetical protein